MKISAKTLSLVLVCVLTLQVAITNAQYAHAEETDVTVEESVEETPEPEEIPQEQEEEPEEESEEEPSEEESDTEIETGDAVAAADVETVVNTNETETNDTEEVMEDNTASSTEEEVAEEETSSSTPEVTEEPEEEEYHSTSTQEHTVTNENEAAIENTASSSAETGDNSASGSGNVSVETGDAYAYANVINVANTNILNSEGFLLFFNQYFGLNSLDLRDVFGVFDDEKDSATSSCSLSGCGDSDVEVHAENTNTAEITNDVVVRSSTGGNRATSTGSSASVRTGDAYAAANVVNVANTNIVDSNYLMVTFNNFGDFAGDIVLPGADFFKGLFGGSDTTSDVTVENDNTADVSNNVTVEANTGENEASSDGGNASVETGDAHAESNVTNQVNTNLFNADSFSILFRIHGSWSGDIFGLPDGMSWTETPYGIQLVSEEDTDDRGDALGVTTVENTNDATINNNVEVYALTGDNKVESDGGDASVETGDAYAAANVVNVANTNIIGRNWALLIFNIFGDWTGNLAFGLPDLWIGGAATSPDNPIGPESDVTYTFTVSNNGDTDATDTILEVTYDENLLSFNSYDGVYMHNGETVAWWNVGTIPQGETHEFSYTAEVDGGINHGDTPISVTATIDAYETDANYEDNTDIIAIIAENNPASGSSKNSLDEYNTPTSEVRVSKTVDKDIITASSSVDYTVTITNKRGSAYHAELVDTLKDEDGNIISEQFWYLGEIYPDEEITVTYTVEFNASTSLGTYTNYAQVYATDRNPSLQPFLGRIADSNIASVDIEVVEELGEVLGVSIENPRCEQYLTEFMRFGRDNNPAEVTRLQTFLRDFEGFSSLSITGEFDTATESAVREFQLRYGEEVLGPWGLKGNTGYVYLTTRKKINEIYCNGEKNFPLTLAQTNEISSYRTLLAQTLTGNTSSALSLNNEHLEETEDSKNPVLISANASEETANEEVQETPQTPRRTPFVRFFTDFVSMLQEVAVN